MSRSAAFHPRLKDLSDQHRWGPNTGDPARKAGQLGGF